MLCFDRKVPSNQWPSYVKTIMLTQNKTAHVHKSVLLERVRTQVYCSNDPEQIHSCKILLPGDVIGRLACALHRKDFTHMS
jgi:hypothetical protein